MGGGRNRVRGLKGRLGTYIRREKVVKFINKGKNRALIDLGT